MRRPHTKLDFSHMVLKAPPSLTTITIRAIPRNVAPSGMPALGLAIYSITSLIRYNNRLETFINPHSDPRTQQAIFSPRVTRFFDHLLHN